MNYCDTCIHREVCGEEDARDPAVTFCAERIEHCGDCISREAAHGLLLPWLNDYLLDETREVLETIDYKIEDLPPVYPAEKVGHWYKKPHEICYTCDQCGTTNASGVKYDFCPHCGACMKEVGDKE